MAKLSVFKRRALGLKAMRRRLFSLKVVQKGLQLWHDYTTDATDKSTNDNHGVMYTGRSLAFDGVNDYVDLDGLTIDGNQMTFALWVKGTQTAITKYLLDFNEVASVNQNRYLFAWTGNTISTLSYFDNGSWNNLGATPNDGSWHRLVFVVDGTNVKAYIDNGTPTSATTSDELNISGSVYSALCSNFNGGSYFSGELSNVQIWDKAWTADDVAYDYANVQATPNDIADNNSALSVANCRTWLPMTEGDGFTLYDGGVVLGDETVTNTAITDWDLSAQEGSELITTGTLSTEQTYGNLSAVYSSLLTSGATYRLQFSLNNGGVYRGFTLNNNGGTTYYTQGAAGTYNVDMTFVADGTHFKGSIFTYGGTSTVSAISIKEVISLDSTYDAGALSIGASNTISQDDVYEGTREYLTELDVSAYTGTVEVQDGAGTVLHTVSATGEQNFTSTANGTTDNLQIVAGSGSSATVDSISVKEVQPKENGTVYDNTVTGATWTTGVVGQPSPKELVTNGTFDADSDWTLGSGYTISAGLLTDGTTGSDGTNSATFALEANKTYTLRAKINGTGGTPTLAIKSGATGISSVTVPSSTYDDLLVHSFTPSNAYASAYIFINGTNFIGTYDNISVKDVTNGIPQTGLMSYNIETIGGVDVLLRDTGTGIDARGNDITNVNNGYLALHGDGYVEVADDASLDITGEITMELWYRYETHSFGQPLGKRISGDNNWVRFYVDTDDTLRFEANDGGVHQAILTPTVIVGEWNHFVGTMTGTTGKFYMNGVLVATDTTFPTVNTDNAKPVEIGKWNTSFTKGDIDEPRIYNRALTEAEVLQNYNAGKNKHRND